MTATSNFFFWYYFAFGLTGPGGWIFFFLLAMAATIWLFYDSAKRELPGSRIIGWRMGVVFAWAMLIPSVILWLGSHSQLSLLPYLETFFYMGIVGGIAAPVLAVGYYVNFQGETGGVREIGDGEIERWKREKHREVPEPKPIPPESPKVAAWLVSLDGGGMHQLNAGSTKIGRSSRNHIMLTGDNTISREHAKISERNGHFTYTDLDSTHGSRINGRRISKTEVLQAGDEIQLGRNMKFRFKK